ncbi:MAG: YggN family protein [Colwellia sp.]|nr:YggN family protein [Colwellia sp.]
MKNIFTISALVLATSLSMPKVYAHDSCNVELESGVKISTKSIEFLDSDKNSLYKIINDEVLIVDGKAIDLNSSQQSMITEYSTSIRAVVPEVKDIALDAITLASDGVNMAFNELLGEDNHIGKEISAELNIIHQQVDEYLSVERGFYIDENGIDGDEIFGEDFESRIEEVVEKAVQNSMGTLLIAVGKELLSSGGNTGTFETRMESFGEKMEHEMETRAQEFEQRAQALCASVVKIDALEAELQGNISELSAINVITASQTHSQHKNKI